MTDRDQLREQVARALYEVTEGMHWDRSSRYETKVLDAVLAVLPEYEHVGYLDVVVNGLGEFVRYANWYPNRVSELMPAIYIVREAEG